MYLFGRKKGGRPDVAVHIYMAGGPDPETVVQGQGGRVYPICGHAAASMDWKLAVESKMEFSERLPAYNKICGHCLARLRKNAADIRQMIKTATRRNAQAARRNMPEGWR